MQSVPTGNGERQTHQTDNGWTPIANEIIEDLARAELTGSQLRLVLAIIRKTYGYQRKMAPISIAELMDATGMARSTVTYSLAQLVEWGVVNKKASPGGRPSEYGYQKYPDRWSIPTGRKAGNIDNLQKKQQSNSSNSSKQSNPSNSSKQSNPSNSSQHGVQLLEQLTVQPLGHSKIKEINKGCIITTQREIKQSNSSNSSGERRGDNMEPKTMDQLMARYTEREKEIIRAYWTAIRRTRKTGKLADSVVQKWMDKWDAKPKDAVIEGMQIHMAKYESKREEYTNGIINRIIREKEEGVKSGQAQVRRNDRQAVGQVFDRSKFTYRRK